MKFLKHINYDILLKKIMLDYFKKLAQEYHMPLENVISIALNRYGILMENLEDNRIRFMLNILDSDKKTFFAVCVNTYDKSPFKLENNTLYLEGKFVGNVTNIEKDTCTSTYFRNNKKSITFNSNARSKCVGCKFCGTYSLTEEDSVDFTTKENIIDYFNSILRENNIQGMKNIENVTVCTGCFNSEDDLIKHLLIVHEAFSDMSFDGRLSYIGSQLRDFKKIKSLTGEIKDFGMFLTLEKFLERHKFMRPEKANLTLENAKDLLEYCLSLGIPSTFLYILGLEDLETVQKYFEYFKNSINKFPIIQVFQDYTATQEQYRCEDAKDLEYYFKARKVIDEILRDKNFNPKLWECYRSLCFEEKRNGAVLGICKVMK